VNRRTEDTDEQPGAETAHETAGRQAPGELGPGEFHLYLLLTLGASAIWIQARFMSPIGWTCLVVALLAPFARRAWTAPSGSAAPVRQKPSWRSASTVAVLSMAPPLLVLSILWNSDFPFLGDHNVHLRFLIASRDFWGRYFVIALIVFIAAACLRDRKHFRTVASVVLVALFVLGAFNENRIGFVVRYPALFHFVAYPANVLAAALDWPSPFNAGRLTNALAIPAWLFVLRPLFVRRWPDLRVLPIAAFLFLQKDVLYYVTSVYLEPWSLILILTASEMLVEHPREGDRALLLLGAAAMVKEQAILMLPIFAAGLAWRERGSLRAVGRHVVTAIVAIAPFLCYYDIRRHAGVFRTSELARLEEAFTADRLTRFASRTIEQFGSATIVVVVLVAALIVGMFRSRVRWLHAASLASVCAVAGFFFVDKVGADWIAYPRFHLVILPLLALPLFLLDESTVLHGRRASLWSAVAIVALNLTPLAAFTLRAGNELELNFFEHIDAPVYFPVREAIERGERDGVILDGQPIEVLSNLHGVVAGFGPYSLSLAYGDLAARHPVSVVPLDARTLSQCRCSGEAAVLGLFVYFPEGRRVEAPAIPMQRVAEECESLARTSCASSFAVRHNGALVAVLGSSAPPESR
jgi:hypothetical protein